MLSSIRILKVILIYTTTYNTTRNKLQYQVNMRLFALRFLQTIEQGYIFLRESENNSTKHMFLFERTPSFCTDFDVIESRKRRMIIISRNFIILPLDIYFPFILFY